MIIGKHQRDVIGREFQNDIMIDRHFFVNPNFTYDYNKFIRITRNTFSCGCRLRTLILVGGGFEYR